MAGCAEPHSRGSAIAFVRRSVLAGLVMALAPSLAAAQEAPTAQPSTPPAAATPAPAPATPPADAAKSDAPAPAAATTKSEAATPGAAVIPIVLSSPAVGLEPDAVALKVQQIPKIFAAGTLGCRSRARGV